MKDFLESICCHLSDTRAQLMRIVGELCVYYDEHNQSPIPESIVSVALESCKTVLDEASICYSKFTDDNNVAALAVFHAKAPEDRSSWTWQLRALYAILTNEGTIHYTSQYYLRTSVFPLIPTTDELPSDNAQKAFFDTISESTAQLSVSFAPQHIRQVVLTPKHMVTQAYRVCYKSQGSQGSEDSCSFIKPLITPDKDNPDKVLHTSPLEHDYIQVVVRDFDIVNSFIEYAHKHSKFLAITRNIEDSSITVVGNLRAWYELALYYWYTHDDTFHKLSVSAADMLSQYLPDIFPQLYAADCEIYELQPQRYDKYATFRVRTSRDILQEFVRHRSLSFNVESTRYVNYMNHGFSFIAPADYKWAKACMTMKAMCDVLTNPSILKQMSTKERCLLDTAQRSVWNYAKIIENKGIAQDARKHLPGFFATEFYVTGTYDAWRSFVKLRKHPAAHPEIRELAEFIDAKIS